MHLGMSSVVHANTSGRGDLRWIGSLSKWRYRARSLLALRTCQRRRELARSCRLHQANREQLLSRGNDQVTAPGIGVVPVFLSLTEGSREEMRNSYANYEKNIGYLASLHCDTISIEGAPPFMILGPDGESKLIDGWSQKYNTDMFTSSQNQVKVLRAMKIKKILGVAPFGADLNKSYANYFEASGIGVVAMEGIDVAFRAIQDVPSEIIYSFIKKKFLEHAGVDAIYILGSPLDALGIVATLEQDLGVPVVQPTAARIWEIQRRFHVRPPIKRFGILLETLPA
jgi:maleate cis-trans isomerase